MEPVSVSEFKRLVAAALDTLPAELGALMENVVVIPADRGNLPELLGLYDGVPLTEREEYGGSIASGGLAMPDRIFVYRRALCEMCADVDELRQEVRVTIVHEVAHHFGIEDERLQELGWA